MDKNDGRVVSTLNQCLNNEDLTIYGEGKQPKFLLC